MCVCVVDVNTVQLVRRATRNGGLFERKGVCKMMGWKGTGLVDCVSNGGLLDSPSFHQSAPVVSPAGLRHTYQRCGCRFHGQNPSGTFRACGQVRGNYLPKSLVDPTEITHC